MLFAIEPVEILLSPEKMSILARRLLKNLLANHYGIYTLPRMEITENGKPYFPDQTEIHFSLSHCSKAVMAAVDSREIGCDIESIPPVVDWDVVYFAFSESEIRKVSESSSPNVEMIAIWTRKEAEAKRIGIIADDPRMWNSESDSLSTIINKKEGYAFSISRTLQ